MDTVHGLIFIVVLLVVLLVGIPSVIYFLTKYNGRLYSELIKTKTYLGCYIFAVFSYFLGKYLTPAFYIFLLVFVVAAVISFQTQKHHRLKKILEK